MEHLEAELTIVGAREANLAQINALIARSKSHWNWPQAYLERALSLHLVTPDYLKRAASFEVWTSAPPELVAFFSLDTSSTIPMLDNLWVEPSYIGKGIGRLACNYVVDLALRTGWSEVSVMPDPPSEGFYARLGFRDTGERVPSRVPGGPLFSVYRIHVGAKRVQKKTA